jgi:phosphate transport system protein
MPTSPHGFDQRLQSLKGELVRQGERVQRLLEAAFTAVFARDPAAADRVASLDDEVDRVDVEVEQRCVQLLTEATREHVALSERQLRAVLTIVKINNEMERVADCGVTIAERVDALASLAGDIPPTFQVMANSVVGVVRDVNRAFGREDAALARIVLQSEDAIEAFKMAILQDAERRIAAGTMSADFAFVLHEIAGECCKMADHCTNIAEQVIYAATGAIVRHMEGKWVEVPRP